MEGGAHINQLLFVCCEVLHLLLWTVASFLRGSELPLLTAQSPSWCRCHGEWGPRAHLQLWRWRSWAAAADPRSLTVRSESQAPHSSPGMPFCQPCRCPECCAELLIAETNVCVLWCDLFASDEWVCCWTAFRPGCWNCCPALMLVLLLWRILHCIKRCLTMEATDFVLQQSCLWIFPCCRPQSKQYGKTEK